MSTLGGPRIVANGLVELLEPERFRATNPESIKSEPSDSTFTLNNFSYGNSSRTRSFLSNAVSDGSGTSYATLTRNTALETGSITFTTWFNLKGIPLDAGANNNWRFIVASSSSGAAPFYMILEESYVLNVSTTSGGTFRRYLDNNFAPWSIDSTGWQMITFTYNHNTGVAVAYKNGSLVRSGPMTLSGGTSPTSGGTSLNYTDYQSGGLRIHGGSNYTANPPGNGITPGELGNVLIYNRALTAAEDSTNYNAMRARYGL